jgi:hypothetical protein
LVTFLLTVLVTSTSHGQAEKRRVIIDTHPGTDDAMAILLGP